MNLSDNLQSYLSENSKKQNPDKNGIGTKLGFWSNQHEVQISEDSEALLADSQQKKGWFDSVRIPFVKQSASNETLQKSKIEKICSCLPTLVCITKIIIV